MATNTATAETQSRIYRRWAPVYDRVYGNILRQAHQRLAEEASSRASAVLEVGVGTGLGLPYYAPSRNITGIDVSKDMLRQAEERKARLNLTNVTLRLMDAHRLNFPDGAFEVVTLPFVLTLLDGPEAVLSECARVTKPGGAIMIASRISRGGYLQSLLENAVAPFARQIGLSSSFHLSTIEQWSHTHSRASLQAVENLRPADFFKLVTVDLA
jgi:phosphatidylethanolamine/phosphatidyl-N-methylethanolamine N-methyltransferase